MEKWQVTITGLNDKGKKDFYVDNVDTLEQVCRVIMTFKSKRGYEVVEYHVDRIDSLF